MSQEFKILLRDLELLVNLGVIKGISIDFKKPSEMTLEEYRLVSSLIERNDLYECICDDGITHKYIGDF